uniref:Pectinesterase n=1 Tax=Taiwania cryptomerioides TaxID=50187 RepID=B0L3S3_TAICR|nr:pectin methylesterase-like protein [Taiwania cryptomerioides]
MGALNIGYDKFNGGTDKHTRRKITRTIFVSALASAFVVGTVIFLAMGINRHGSGRDDDEGSDHVRRWKSTSNAVKNACSSTLYQELCVSSISSYEGLSSQAGHMEILDAAVNVAINAVKKGQAHTRSLFSRDLDSRQRGALNDCMEMYDDTLDELHDTLSDLHNATFLSMPKHAADLETLLSAAITNQFTCLEGFTLCKGHLKQQVKGELHNVSHLVSNSLATVGNISARAKQALGIADSLADRRRLLSESFVSTDEEGFPSWMSVGDRRLLQVNVTNITANAVVAKDGSGHYSTISAAVDAAPEKSTTRFIIYVKKGVYQENVEIHKKKHFLMFIGDGEGVTVVTASRSVRGSNHTTFHSATVAVTGKGFIARDMTFENTAGPSNHQAVALRVGSDFSVFYRCSFKGYQDTLYVHSLRQFFRDCDIYGTVDFIFGNAAVVFQNCNLYARKPLENQQIMYTAQGRQDPNQNTGISIHNCRVTADSDMAAVKSSFKTYLGRPWKEYSRTVFLQSYLDDLIHPAGWLEWNETFALSTLYYGEYMNTGPGAGTANRVNWPGYRVITSATEASQFTVNQFIEGDTWLPSTGVEYSSGLA